MKNLKLKDTQIIDVILNKLLSGRLISIFQLFWNFLAIFQMINFLLNLVSVPDGP
jgi:hypothetical protein